MTSAQAEAGSTTEVWGIPPDQSVPVGREVKLDSSIVDDLYLSQFYRTLGDIAAVHAVGTVLNGEIKENGNGGVLVNKLSPDINHIGNALANARAGYDQLGKPHAERESNNLTKSVDAIARYAEEMCELAGPWANHFRDEVQGLRPLISSIDRRIKATTATQYQVSAAGLNIAYDVLQLDMGYYKHAYRLRGSDELSVDEIVTRFYNSLELLSEKGSYENDVLTSEDHRLYRAAREIHLAEGAVRDGSYDQARMHYLVAVVDILAYAVSNDMGEDQRGNVIRDAFDFTVKLPDIDQVDLESVSMDGKHALTNALGITDHEITQGDGRESLCAWTLDPNNPWSDDYGKKWTMTDDQVWADYTSE